MFQLNERHKIACMYMYVHSVSVKSEFIENIRYFLRETNFNY